MNSFSLHMIVPGSSESRRAGGGWWEQMFPVMPVASADGVQGVTRLKSSTFKMTPPAEV